MVEPLLIFKISAGFALFLFFVSIADAKLFGKNRTSNFVFVAAAVLLVASVVGIIISAGSLGG